MRPQSLPSNSLLTKQSVCGSFSIVISIYLSLAFSQNALAFTKKKFDFIVGVNGDFKAAMASAASKASATNRFYIFFPDGDYNIGPLTGDKNQKTTFSTSNVSFIGQSADKTLVYNKSIQEDISATATLFFSKANNLYLQDLTVENKAVTVGAATRHVAIQEQGNRIIYKNVKLKATQDTYYTKDGTRTYWEDGMIYGTTDFICGGGDVFFNRTTLYTMKVSAITAPATTSTWGYVFKDGVIDGTVSGFVLGRSWGSAKAVFINTTMKKLPSDAGWGDPMNSVPQVFAEYKSITATGSLVDLSKRRKSYSKNGVTVTLNPILSDAEAAKYTIANVLAGSDNWKPDTYTQQASPPVLALNGNTVTWADDAKALCWVVFKNGKYLANVTVNSFDLSGAAKGDIITVRAANEMGGLGLASNALVMGSGTQPPSSIVPISSTIVNSSSSAIVAVSSSVATSSSSVAAGGTPSVRFLAPTSGADLPAPATIQVEVEAIDSDGSISNVKLYLNGTLVRQEGGAPYKWNDYSQDVVLQNLAAGTYSLKAVATDNSGVTGEASLSLVVRSTTSIKIHTQTRLVNPADIQFDLLGRHTRKN